MGCYNIPLLLACLLATFLSDAAIAAEDGETQDEPFSSAQIEFFESKVRPLLAENCLMCHGEKKQQAHLRLDSRASILRGGDSGSAIVSGAPEKSLLAEAINFGGLEMPPKGQLDQWQIEIMEEWIRQGAPWPNESATQAKPAETGFAITDADRRHWAYQPIQRPTLPEPSGQFVWQPIDAFTHSKLREQGLEQNSTASPRQLIRRAYFDLLGLPPTMAAVEKFQSAYEVNPTQAMSDLIDELLDRPQFGERWGRHWLDVVRFGQTNGYERDDEKIGAWRYRDYVIESFNQDKPFDQFIIEQLAGDELEQVSQQSVIATGFYRLGLWDDEPAEKTQALYDEQDDMLRVIGAAFLGTTIGCARCHDHMFDPISQRDYYELLAFIRNVAPYGRDRDGKSETHWELDPTATYTPLATLDEMNAWRSKRELTQEEIRGQKEQAAQLSKQIAELETRQAAAAKDAEKSAESNAAEQQMVASLKSQLEELHKKIVELEKSPLDSPFENALSVREHSGQPPETHLLIRGNPQTKGDLVEPRFLQVLSSGTATNISETKPAEIPPGRDDARIPPDYRLALQLAGIGKTSGRRTELARWIASPENPLTARVMVNRIWQHLFGRGIVPSTNNFGRAGTLPTHPELLDWLAAELIEQGWRMKPLIKTIMLSQTYQQSSSAKNPRGLELDAANDLFWRQNLRRLEAEALRDSILAVSGKLNPKMGGRGIFPELSADVLATQSRPGSGWTTSDPEEQNRRSVYIFVKRTLMVPMLESFDYTNTSEPLGVRPITTVAPQALIMLNDKFIEQQAAALAESIRAEAGNDMDRQIQLAFVRAFSRLPNEKEIAFAVQLFEQVDGVADAETASQQGLNSLCLVVLNLNEFIYID